MKQVYLIILLCIVSLSAFGATPEHRSTVAQGSAVRVDTQRVMGVTIGLVREDTSALKQEAEGAALRQVQALAAVYDMLVGVTFLSRPSGGKLKLDTAGSRVRGEGATAAVSGSAPLVDQGKIESDRWLWDEFAVPADSQYIEAPKACDSISAQADRGSKPQGSEPLLGKQRAMGAQPIPDDRPIWSPPPRARKLGVSYLSLKYRLADNASGLGIEYDYLKQLTPYHRSGCYLGGSFNVSIDDRAEIGGGLSAGWPLEVTDWLQVIPGGSVGYWTFEERSRHWDTNEVYFAIGGPFVRLLIGSGNHWLDISDRLLFGDRALNQIMLGYTYTWAKSEQL